jgi:hypothetical protein
MGINFVPNTGGGNNFLGSSSSIEQFAAVPITAGNAIVVIAEIVDTTGYKTVTSITDTAGNNAKYTLCGSRYQFLFAATYYVNIEFWIALDVAANAANKVTVNYSTANQGVQISTGSWSGITSHDTGYDPSGNVDATSPYATTPANTAENNELIIGGFFSLVGTSQTLSSSSPSVLRDVGNVSGIRAIAENAADIAGSFGVALASTINESWVCFAKAFKSNPITMSFRTGATEAACLAASWTELGTLPDTFSSSGFAQLRVEVSSGKASFSDTFSGDLSAWTVVAGTWVITSGVLQNNNGDSSWTGIYYNSPTNTDDQYIEFKVINPGIGSGNRIDIIFRGTEALASGDWISFEANMGDFELNNADGEVIGTSLVDELTGGHYYGIEISGARNNSTVNLYDNGTSSVARPWSNPIKTWANVDLTADNPEGRYLGIAIVHNAANKYQLDDFKAGDQ